MTKTFLQKVYSGKAQIVHSYIFQTSVIYNSDEVPRFPNIPIVRRLHTTISPTTISYTFISIKHAKTFNSSSPLFFHLSLHAFLSYKFAYSLSPHQLTYTLWINTKSRIIIIIIIWQFVFFLKSRLMRWVITVAIISILTHQTDSYFLVHIHQISFLHHWDHHWGLKSSVSSHSTFYSAFTPSHTPLLGLDEAISPSLSPYTLLPAFHPKSTPSLSPSSSPPRIPLPFDVFIPILAFTHIFWILGLFTSSPYNNTQHLYSVVFTILTELQILTSPQPSTSRSFMYHSPLSQSFIIIACLSSECSGRPALSQYPHLYILMSDHIPLQISPFFSPSLCFQIVFSHFLNRFVPS